MTRPIPQGSTGKGWIPSRRSLLKAGLGIVGITGLGAAGYYLSRDSISVGLIGCGGRGNDLANICKLTGYYAHRYLRVDALVDVNSINAEKTRAMHADKAAVYQDYRRILDRKDIEAVIIAAPDHHHVPIAIAALQAGKAVYLEKPMAHTVVEGRKLVEVVVQTNQVLLVGTQQRNDAHFRYAAEIVRQGRLGKLKQVIVTIAGKGATGGPFSEKPVPTNLNWDGWLGTAPKVPYCPERHENWHNWWDYGGGELTNWGIHHLDIVQWALNADATGPVKVESLVKLPNTPNGYECPTMFTATLTYADGLQVEVKTNENNGPAETNNGIEFFGESGSIFVNRSKITGQAFNDLSQRPLSNESPLHPTEATWTRTTVRHLDHFAKCIRRLEKPVADAEIGQRSSTTCNLINIAQRLGRPLQWNPATEQFVNDSEANTLLDKPRRVPL